MRWLQNYIFSKSSTIPKYYPMAYRGIRSIILNQANEVNISLDGAG
ncbi:hypothetical protein HZA71_00585 [Candidatus Falkowbacteria bacterium]|nr:hypothetical protein [Candidatus Falkowbacteria bacterium]